MKREYLATAQVAAWLGYSQRTIADWAQQYQDSGGLEGIPAFKPGRRGWRFDKAVLEEWILQKQSPTQDLNNNKKKTA